MVNVIVSAPVWEMHKKVARDSDALVIRGMLESSPGAINVIAERINRLPMTLRTKSRDYR